MQLVLSVAHGLTQPERLNLISLHADRPPETRRRSQINPALVKFQEVLRRALIAHRAHQSHRLSDIMATENLWQGGAHVRVVGLVNAAQHNGKLGTLDKKTGDRWGVLLDERAFGAPRLAVKESNLELVEPRCFRTTAAAATAVSPATTHASTPRRA